MMQFQHLHSFMPMKIPSFYGARCDIRILLSFPRFRGVAEKPLCSDQISVEIGAKKTAENGESRWPGTHRDVEPWRQGSFPPKTRPFWPLNFGSTSFGFGKWDPENFREIKVGDFFWKHLAGHKLLFKTKRCPLDIHWKASLIFWCYTHTCIYIYTYNMNYISTTHPAEIQKNIESKRCFAEAPIEQWKTLVTCCIEGIILSSYIGIITNPYKDPY